VRFLTVLSFALLALIAGGCLHDGGTETVTVRETVTETAATGTVPSEAPVQVSLYFLQDRKVWPEQRSFVSGPELTTATVNQLLEGPTTDLTTAIPAGTRVTRLTIDGGVAAAEFAPPITNRAAQAQVVYTLTQFEWVTRVSFNGARPVGTRAYEPQTPAVLVQSPLGGEDVESGFEATGTANTFEATFNYELRDASNRVLAENYVTATSGTGTRGTFRFTVRYQVNSPQQGRLIVFEISAADGSRINEVSIPLQLR
jgi:Immunoglobulin-like domain of bacterial spore germination/Sporulation and spore germination